MLIKPAIIACLINDIMQNRSVDNNKATENSISAELLPDFCTNQTVLTAMLIGELLAIVLTTSTGHWNLNSIAYLAYASLFIQWIALTDIAVLCWGKRLFARLTPVKMMAAVYISLQLVTLFISEIGYQVVIYANILVGAEEQFHLRLIISNLIISGIITAVAMRYFYLQHQSVQRLNAQTQSKIEALQARIRPHFLFNSMNTIANLIHVDPDKAEDAVLDLSELFRSSLGKHDYVSLREEIQITQRYVNIESLRLGERLKVMWQVPRILPSLQMPALMLQPLVENAIYHGIEPIREGGVIDVIIDVEEEQVRISINNPVPQQIQEGRRKGNQIALSNIKQRLALSYGENSSMQISHTDQQHAVVLLIPLDQQEDDHASINR